MPAIEAKGSVNIGGVRTHCPNITLLLSGHLGVQAEGALVREYDLGSFSWSRETPRKSTEQLMVSPPHWSGRPWGASGITLASKLATYLQLLESRLTYIAELVALSA